MAVFVVWACRALERDYDVWTSNSTRLRRFGTLFLFGIFCQGGGVDRDVEVDIYQSNFATQPDNLNDRVKVNLSG